MPLCALAGVSESAPPALHVYSSSDCSTMRLCARTPPRLHALRTLTSDRAPCCCPHENHVVHRKHGLPGAARSLLCPVVHGRFGNCVIGRTLS